MIWQARHVYSELNVLMIGVGSVGSVEISAIMIMINKEQSRDLHPMLFQCYLTVFGAGPTLKQHWVNSPYLLGCGSVGMIH